MATLNGTDGNDNIVGTIDDDTINAFRHTSPGGDTVDGKEGIDTLVVDASGEFDNVQLTSGGVPTFMVRSNSDNYYVNAYNMERVDFTGGSGDDSISMSTHGGSVNGGGGIDFWQADISAVATGIVFNLATTHALAEADLTAILNIEQIDLATGGGNDTITGGAYADHIYTQTGDDTINARTVVSGGANDFVDGGAGTDTLVVDTSSETDSVTLSSGGAPTFTVRSSTGNFAVDAFNMERVQFTGGSANDSISMGNHAGTVNGGAGIDFWQADVSAVASNINFNLATSHAINAAGITNVQGIEQIDLKTGSGKDTITGGAYADHVQTGGGNDTINAMTVVAGGPNDYVDGGGSTDTLIVNAALETDTVQLSSGGSPTYAVRSASGNFAIDAYNVEKVQITTGSGNDTIDSKAGGVVVDGGAGVDKWIANYGSLGGAITFVLGTTTAIAAAGLNAIQNIEQIDLTTGNGNDAITGGTFADHIATGGGSDTINAKTTLSGGPNDNVDGGAGTDTLIVDASAETSGVQLISGGAPSYAVHSISGNFGVDAYNVEKVQFTGGAGNDTIDTRAGGVVVDGGAGLDKWIADLSAVSGDIVFTLGTTTAIAGAGLTSILNIEQIDLATGAGNDSIVGGMLADNVYTGAGNDTIDAGQRVAGANGIDVVDGAAGTDTLVVNASAETSGVQLYSGGSPTFQVRSNSGNLYVNAYNMENVQFIGGLGNDTITTGNHAGSVDGGVGGNDSWTADLSGVGSAITFLLGTTTSIAGAGLTSILNIDQITLTTGGGKDSISGGFLADTINTGANNDTIDAGQRVAGSSQIDVVDGGDGTDTLIVSAASEVQAVQLSSGGAPTFQVRSNSGNYYVNAYNMEKIQFTSGSGNDNINTGNHAGTVDAGAGIDYWLADLNAVASNITFNLATTHSIGSAGLTSIQNIERIDLTTGTGNDTITGGAYADHIVTGAGDDTINAGTKVFGDSAIDVVDGGAGNDTLVVAAGTEVRGMQVSFGGAPTFQVRSNSGNYYINAYNTENIQFTSGSGNDNVSGGNGNDQITTGNGHDLLQGGLGQDLLSGGSGADSFVFADINDSTNAASDLITDLGAGDVIDLSGIDADATTGGNQAFILVGILDSHVGEAALVYDGVSGKTSLLLDTDGDGLANATILLTGNQTGFVDFVL